MTVSRSGIEFAGRLDALDGIRTLAVLAVFVVHAATAVLPAGDVGVDVFFVLSGFVITLLLLRELENTTRIRFGRFYLNRLVRLWPALLLMVTAVVATNLFGLSSAREARLGGESSLYLFDFERAFHWSGNTSGSAFGHTWSLAVEEQFYLAWPIFLLLLYRWRGLLGALVGALVLAAVPVAIRLSVWDGGQGFDRIYNMPDTRADQLLIGCALALALTYFKGRAEPLRKFLAASIWPSAAVLLLYARFAPEANGNTSPLSAFTWTFGVLLVGLVAGFLIGGVAVSPKHPLARLLRSHALAWPGRHLSYGFYLWHYPLVLMFLTFGVSAPVRFVGAFAIATAVALISARFVEEPARRAVRLTTDRIGARRRMGA